MRQTSRLLRVLVLAVPLLSAVFADGQPPLPKSTPAPMPAPAPAPKAASGKNPSPNSTKADPAAESAEKRRERMKQRDGEIDRLLKGKQKPKR